MGKGGRWEGGEYAWRQTVMVLVVRWAFVVKYEGKRERENDGRAYKREEGERDKPCIQKDCCGLCSCL